LQERCLSREEPLGEGGDEDNFNQESNERFDRRYCRLQVTGLEDRRKESTPMESRHAYHQRLVPGKG
jgi:hypothetical protein